MISDTGLVSYQAVQSSFLEWRPSNAILRDFLFAVITTLISFQTTAAVMDFSFGLKSWGCAAISDVQTLLLVRNASPPQVVKSIFPNTFARFRFSSEPSTPSLPPQESNTTRIHPKVLFKLLCLLTAVPLLNLIPVILVFEYDTVLSMSEARVGGFALGVNMDFRRENFTRTSSFCLQNHVQLRDRELPLIQLSTCDSGAIVQGSRSVDMAYIRVEAKGGMVSLVVGTGFRSVTILKQAVLEVGEGALVDSKEYLNSTTFLVHHGVTKRSAEDLIRFGRQRMESEICQDGVSPPVSSTTSLLVPTPPPNAEFSLQRSFQCAAIDTGADGRPPMEMWVAYSMLQKVTLVNHTDTMILPGRGSAQWEGTSAQHDFINGEGLPFLKRRRTNASFWTLVVILASATVVRLFVFFFTRNDLEVGVGLIVRAFLSLPCCDSMLPYEDLVISHGHDVAAVRPKWMQSELEVDTFFESNRDHSDSV